MAWNLGYNKLWTGEPPILNSNLIPKAGRLELFIAKKTVFSRIKHMEQKTIKINKVMLLIGIVIIIIAASMMFCQERCFLRVDLELWPAFLGIIGMVLISTSAVLGIFKNSDGTRK